MQRSIKVLCSALASLVLLTACQTLPISGRLPDGLTALKIRSVDKDSPFALSPDNSVLAIGSDGLKLFHLTYREDITLGERAPLQVAWSPLGDYLAALYTKDGRSSIAVYDNHGIPIVESEVDAKLTTVAWLSENELLAGGMKITPYKFGSNYRSLFLRWKPGRDMPTETGLRESTLQPTTVANWKNLLERGPMLEISGQSATLLYLHPVDPPMFTPYYKLIMRDLASGKELEIASVGFQSDGGKFSADGEKILYGDGKGETLLYNPWSEEQLVKRSAAGKNPAISPDGGSWISDGAFFRAGTAVLPLAEGISAKFNADGSRIIIREGKDLYLLSGLKPAEGTMFVPAVAEKVAKLRSMRLQGLVTPKEYKESLLKITAP